MGRSRKFHGGGVPEIFLVINIFYRGPYEGDISKEAYSNF